MTGILLHNNTTKKELWEKKGKCYYGIYKRMVGLMPGIDEHTEVREKTTRHKARKQIIKEVYAVHQVWTLIL